MAALTVLIWLTNLKFLATHWRISATHKCVATPSLRTTVLDWTLNAEPRSHFVYSFLPQTWNINVNINIEHLHKKFFFYERKIVIADNTRKTRWINDHNESLLKKIIPLIRKEIDKKATYHWWGPEKKWWQ